MNRRIAIITVIACLLAAPALAGDPILLVVDQADNALQVYDGNSYKLIESIRTERGPHRVVVSPDNRFAYVSDFGSHTNTISIVDLKILARTGQIDPKPMYGPHDMVISRDGRFLYCTVERSRSVAEINRKTGKVTRTFPTGEMGTHNLVLSPDGNSIFAANNIGNNVSVIDLGKSGAVRSVISDRGAEGIDITPDGKTVWVANRTGQSISVIDATTLKRVRKIPRQGYPIDVRFTNDGKRAWVAVPAFGIVVLYDVASGEELGTVRTGGTPVSILLRPDGGVLFAANQSENSISVIDTKELKVTKQITAGKAPEGMAWAIRP